MKLPFTNRQDEIRRLDTLKDGHGGLIIVHGRRRVGKTRLLMEWIDENNGFYHVGDRSSPSIQRTYLAESLATRFPGFGDVEYRDWGTLLSRLAREAKTHQWTGPLVIDELPYLIHSSPELPSILQRWLDHEASETKLSVVLAGSSQRMMQGLALDANSPLHGRAREILHITPLSPWLIPTVFGIESAASIVETWTAWGGIPRYWELAIAHRKSTRESLQHLVLDPLGPLHEEPSRLLIEELPPAHEVRPLLDAIGMGAHRVSEIAGRVGQKSTSLSRPLQRLVQMKLIKREIPFGESEKSSKRSLYRIADPLIRLWFRVVAPHRAFLSAAPRKQRMLLMDKYWTSLVSEAWEDLARLMVPNTHDGFGPASRWWHGTEPEWDLIAHSPTKNRILLGEAKWSKRPFTKRSLELATREVAARAIPQLPSRFARLKKTRSLFVPSTTIDHPEPVNGVSIITLDAIRYPDP